MKILISGGTGFVGTNISKYLLSKGTFNIIGLERKKTAAQTILWEELEETEIPLDTEVFIHLTGKAHDLSGGADEDEYMKVNVDLTKKLFQKFTTHPTATKFIFLSSVKAAADTVEHILTEEVIPTPQTPYGRSKLAAETYLLNAPLPAHKKVYILRPCIIHGPGNKGNLNLLYNVIKKGIPYPLGAFNNQRSFLSIGNLCFIIEQLLVRDISAGIYNIADTDPISTNHLVKLIGNSLHKKARVLSIPRFLINGLSRISDVLKLPLNSQQVRKMTDNYVVSNKKILNAIQTDLPYPVNEGLKNTFDSFNSSR